MGKITHVAAEDKESILTLLKKGSSGKSIAAQFNVSEATVTRIRKKGNVLKVVDEQYAQKLQKRRQARQRAVIDKATISKSSRSLSPQRIKTLKTNYLNALSAAKVPGHSQLPKSRAPTIEELTARQNELLMKIVCQNQQMLTKTNEILRQNQQLMKMVIKDHLENTPEDDEMNFTGEDEEEGEEIIEDYCQFEISDEEDLNPLSGIEDGIDIKMERHPKEEEEEQEIVKMKEVKSCDKFSVSSTSPTKRRKVVPKISSPPTIKTPQIMKPLQQSSSVKTFVRAKNPLTQIFPITSVAELRAIDEQMDADVIFKRGVLDYIREIKKRGEGTAQLVEKGVLEDMKSVNGRNHSNFLAEVQIARQGGDDPIYNEGEDDEGAT